VGSERSDRDTDRDTDRDNRDKIMTIMSILIGHFSCRSWNHFQ